MKKYINFRQKNEQGFTLLELMITVAVLGIAVSLAVPSYQSTMTQARLTKAADSLKGAISLARSEAIIRGMQTDLRSGTPRLEANGSPDLDGSGELQFDPGGAWVNGWAVTFIEATPGGNATRVIKVFEGLDRLTITNIADISFLETGRRNDLAANGPVFNLRICDSSGLGRELTVNVSGGVREARIDTACAP